MQLSHRWYLVLGLLLAIGVSGCAKGSPSRLAHVSLRQEWFPNANYAGAVLARDEFAAANGIVLEIRPGSDNVDPIKTVLQGSDDFADAAADRVIAANAKGADLVVVGVVNLDSPVCFVTRKRDHILSPKDFEGRRVGVLAGTTTEYVYRALVGREHLDPKRIHEVEVPFDLGTFITGAYDVRPAFIYDEPVSMDTTGIEYNIISPKAYGLHFLGTVYFTRGSLVRKNPDLVRRFVRTVADGWRATIKYPEKALEHLQKYDPSLDMSRERKSLTLALPYMGGRDGRPLDASLPDWDETIAALRSLGVIDTIDARSLFNDSFIKRYYNELEDKGRP
jgi:NitT/TauT family transport system substrate-binding protein